MAGSNNDCGIEQGTWYTIHTLALHAKSHDQKMAFKILLVTLSNHYRCKTCRDHITEYLQQNPMEVYWNREDGLFFWSWKFHNAVNRRLGKPEIDYHESIPMYRKDWMPTAEPCPHCNIQDDTTAYSSSRTSRTSSGYTTTTDYTSSRSYSSYSKSSSQVPRVSGALIRPTYRSNKLLR
uniref:thiol oxidase n=1 Tax=viral metagenome TaxID=1070528 RepID=A0A6C0BMZ5_9ZZZZ